MTKKDFELIASILKYRIITLDDNTSIKILVNDFSKNLEDLYPRFNKEKFLQACGVESVIVLTDKDHSKEYIEAEEKSFLEECK